MNFAAAIAALLLGIGLYLGLQRLQREQRSEIVKSESTPKPNVTATQDDKPNSPVAASTPQPEPQRTDEPHRRRLNQTLAVNTRRIRNAVLREQQLAQEQKRAEAAKEQLMLALRVVSMKFGYAQKKAQELNQKDQIHNQHKTG